jgi:Ras GTPase-activating protein 1
MCTNLLLLSSDIPPDVLTFTITVYNKGKRSKDTEVAELTVELGNLNNGDEVSSKFNWISYTVLSHNSIIH